MKNKDDRPEEATELRRKAEEIARGQAAQSPPVEDFEASSPACRVVPSDITERKRSEEAPRERETQLRATLESTADGILALDNKGKVVQASRRFTELRRIPQSLIERRDDRALLDFALSLLKGPDSTTVVIPVLTSGRWRLADFSDAKAALWYVAGVGVLPVVREFTIALGANTEIDLR
jgi:PAS domain-containing protein